MRRQQGGLAWLTKLKSATAGPADVRHAVRGCGHRGADRFDMNADLTRAYAEGRSVASSILGRDFSTRPGDAGTQHSTPDTGWRNGRPDDGIANYAVLENLAASDGISTVVLDSSTMPPSPQRAVHPERADDHPGRRGPGPEGPAVGRQDHPDHRLRQLGDRLEGDGLLRGAAVPGRDRDDRRGAARAWPGRSSWPRRAAGTPRRPGQRSCSARRSARRGCSRSA